MTLNVCPTWSRMRTDAVLAHTAKRGGMGSGSAIELGKAGLFAGQFTGSYVAGGYQRLAVALDRDVTSNFTQPPVC